MPTDTLVTKTFTPVKNTMRAIRRTRRAYLGLHVAAFEQAQTGFAKAREMTDGLFEELVTKGEAIEDKAGVTFKDTQAKFKENYGETAETVLDFLPFPKKSAAKLEAEVEELTAKLKTLKKKPAAKKKTVKKAAPKKTTTKKTAVKTKAAPKTTTVKTAAAKTETKTDATADKYVSYIEDVRGYDNGADAAIVKKIVDHCGISLQSRDGLFVACSDETERHTVRDSWLVKKLGLKAETAELDAKVMTVCETMQKDRMKSRVTFYYLLAKNEGKLASL